MILNTLFRGIWVVTAFCLAAFVALAALFALGALWAMSSALLPRKPMLHHGAAPVFGVVLFASTAAPALTCLPLVGVVAGDAAGALVDVLCTGRGASFAVPLLVGVTMTTCKRSPQVSI